MKQAKEKAPQAAATAQSAKNKAQYQSTADQVLCQAPEIPGCCFVGYIGISKVIPVVGGAISGGLNFASMHPMAKRLAVALDKASFDYTEADVIKDYEEVQKMAEEPPTDQGEEKGSDKDHAVKSVKHVGNGIRHLLPKRKKSSAPTSGQSDDVFTKIEKLTKLKEMGALTQEEYNAKKADLLSQI